MAANACFQKVSRSTSPDTPRPDTAGQRFPKTARLRQTRDFTRVREHGKSAQARLIRVGCLRTGGVEPAKAGIITSRRVGGAVVRNKVRRRLREIIKTCLAQIPAGLLVVVVAKSAADGASFEQLKAEWLLLARRLSILPPLE
ncbi:MAG: ribonuclease P protein component [Spartobacteria bacterium]